MYKYLLSAARGTRKLSIGNGLNSRSISVSSARQAVNLNGVFTPVATPFNNDESIAYDKLNENFSKWNSTNVTGYLVQGSNGEVVFLSPEERVQLIAAARAAVPKDKVLLAGAGAESTLASIDLSEKMAAAGADAVVHITPCYYKPALNDRALINHYEQVADKSPVPVVLYSMPAYAGLDLSVAAVKVLSQHPNIIGMKDSAGDVTKLSTLIQGTKDNNFQVLAGSAGYLLAALHIGCAGGVCALGNILPKELSELYSLYKRSPADPEVLSLQYKILQPNAAVTKLFGVAGLKQAMDWLGYYGGPVRRPLLPLVDADKNKLREILTPFMQ